MKKILDSPRRIFYVAIVVAGALVAGELLAKSVILWRWGIPGSNYYGYYLDDPRLNLLTWSLKFSPHPYFGYESPALREFESQRGHLSEDDYVIALIGGSVASQFAEYASEHPEHFEPLRSALPELGNKRIVVANLALGAGRQPQQYFIAAFFLDDVDLFVSIEGLNEAVIQSFLPVYPLEFPSLMIGSYERTTRGRIYRWLVWPLIAAYRTANWLALELPLLSRSNLYFLTWRVVTPRLHRAVQSLQVFYVNAVRNDGSGRRRLPADELLERKVQLWRRYVLLQDALTNGTPGKRGFVFLQPNQYLKGSKRFSEVEKATAIDPANYRYFAPMERFKAEFQTFIEKGLRAYDLTEVFKDTEETVYTDFCCHINSVGNEIIAKAIVSRIYADQARSTKKP